MNLCRAGLCAFDYDTLPYLMKRAFNDFGITSPYYVAIKKL
ncbi:MAG: hypothetical protein R2788_15065 [Saprospiraceae bacterium]